MSDWLRTEKRTVDRRDRISGKGRTTNGGSFVGLIQSVSGANQSAQVSYSGGATSTSLPHPYEGAMSWIRAIPDTGSSALMTYRIDTSDPVILRYLNDNPTSKIAGYDSGMNLYRPLSGGEIEIHSVGLAQTSYGQRPILEQRGGMIRSWLDQDKLESGQQAPLHTRRLWQYSSPDISDEERFGVVRRPIKLNAANATYLKQTKSSNFSMYPYPDFTLPGGVAAAFSSLAQTFAAATEAASALTGTFKIRPFAKEYLRVIGNPIYPIPPVNLIDIREGQVFDDDGIQVVGDTGAYLRAKYEYYTPLTDSTKCQIDEIGNISWSLSLGATTGWITNIPLGAYKLTANKGIDLATATSITTSSTLSTSISATTNLSLTSRADTAFSTGLNFSHSTTGTYSSDATLDMSLSSKLNLNTTAGAIYTAKAGTQLNLTAPMVALGALPIEPLVMGASLSVWLSALCKLFITNRLLLGIGNLSAPVSLNPDIADGFVTLLGMIPKLTSKTVTVSL